MTCSTTSSRSGNRSREGTWKGMPAWRILNLARVRRWFMVGTGTRKACAISAVLSPPSERKVRAICASGASAGWQQVKISLRRSSGKASASTSSSSSRGVSKFGASAASLRSSTLSRRRRSSALRRATVVIQAAGLRGWPAAGQRSSAATSVSCSASSARSKSPSAAMSEPSTRPCSARKVSSTASAAVEGGIRQQLGQSRVRSAPAEGTALHFDAKLHDRAHLHRAAPGAGDHGRQLDGLIQVLAVQQIIAAQLLLGFGVWPVGGDRLAVAHAHGGGGAGGLERLAAQVSPAVTGSPRESAVASHIGLLFFLRHTGFGLLVGVDHQ